MRYLAVILSTMFSFGAHAAPLEQMKSLTPFIGLWTTASGTADGSDKFEDVAKWEWAFGGKVVRITHSVNKGAYAGESLIHWDDAKEKIIYRYVNTATFYTDGIITPQPDGSIQVHEFVRGSKTGPTESLSGYKVENDVLVTWSKFKTGGEWGERSDFSYNRTPNADVVIKD